MIVADVSPHKDDQSTTSMETDLCRVHTSGLGAHPAGGVWSSGQVKEQDVAAGGIRRNTVHESGIWRDERQASNMQ
jgi:hypothetical protein